MSVDVCVICNLPESSSDDKLRSVQAGLPAIIKYGEMLELSQLTKVVNESQGQAISIKFHQRCQKDVYSTIRSHEWSLKSNKPSAKKAHLSRNIHKDARFDWKSCCLLCAQPCSVDERHPDRSNFGRCSYKQFHETLLRYIEGRTGGKAALLRHRLLTLSNYSDFVDAEARYHRSCRDSFNNESLQNHTPTPVRGRQISSKEDKNFETLCEWLEGEAELYAVSELHQKMVELAESHENVYSKKWFKNRLKKKYSNTIFFAEVNGEADVVCFEDTASSIVNDAWFQNRQAKGEDETRCIVKTAAKIIASELRSLTYSTVAYPTEKVISDLNANKDWLPDHFRIFMETLVKDPLHQVSLGQALAHSMRPRSTIRPILFVLSVELDHVFGLK